MRPKLLVIAGVLVTPLVTAATALAGNGGFAPVAPESPNAHAIKQSYLFISLFAFAIFLLVEGLLIGFVIRYRRRNRPREADGAQIHGANKLEVSLKRLVAAFTCAKSIFPNEHFFSTENNSILSL